MNFNAVVEELPSLLEKIGQQIYLSGVSTLLAIAIGIPLGITTVKKPGMRRAILSVVNIVQTIPSIALLAFLIPLLGIGVKPALVALSIYAILPIVHSTFAGINGIPNDLIEAADSLGFTPLKKLWMVELPLALPVMLAGIRTAAVMSVGIATIAAFIGAGGLGDFIYRGISTNNTPLVLMGAIPAAALALLMDFLFGYLENLSATKCHRSRAVSKKYKAALVCVFLAAIVVGFFLLNLSYPAEDEKKTIVVATKDFTEQYILGELIAQTLEAKTNLKVIRKFNLGATDVCHRALIRGEIDLYPEYSGTGLLAVLKEKPIAITPTALFDYVKTAYKKKFGITWLPPFGFNNSQTLCVKETFAAIHHLATISDLKVLAPQLTIAAPAEFLSRPDAYPGLKRVYGLAFKEVRQMAPTLVYKAIENEQADVILAFSTDGKIMGYHLTVLKDDKDLFPSYLAAILMREKTLHDFPQVQEALTPLFGSIDNETMRRMNYAVDIDQKTPRDVAENFLRSKGILRVLN